MSIIEQATRRLEELNRAGVSVPWDAAGLASSDIRRRVDSRVRVESETHPAPRAVPSRPVANTLQAAPQVDVTLDLATLAKAGYLVPGQVRSLLAEEFRQIKRTLLKNARSKDTSAHRLALIMVTSAMPGEGKTFSAINLALSIATEIDLSVLLIDADVVRPEAMTRLGVVNRQGLLDVLADKSLVLDELILRTNVPKLSLLPSGRHSHLSTELLGSTAMETLLRRLATEYPGQIVIFDAPPLLLTSEAKALASRVGQVVIVVEAARTPRATLRQAFDAVDQCPIVVSVLNKSRGKAFDDGYPYGDPSGKAA